MTIAAGRQRSAVQEIGCVDSGSTSVNTRGLGLPYTIWAPSHASKLHEQSMLACSLPVAIPGAMSARERKEVRRKKQASNHSKV